MAERLFSHFLGKEEVDYIMEIETLKNYRNHDRVDGKKWNLEHCPWKNIAIESTLTWKSLSLIELVYTVKFSMETKTQEIGDNSNHTKKEKIMLNDVKSLLDEKLCTHT